MTTKHYAKLIEARKKLLDKKCERLKRILERLENCSQMMQLECEIAGDLEFRSLTESVVSYLEDCSFGGEPPTEYEDCLSDLFGFGAAFLGYERVLKIMAEHDRLLMKDLDDVEPDEILGEIAILEKAAEDIRVLFDRPLKGSVK